jgi:DNA-binding XRE family transcriptional regulator
VSETLNDLGQMRVEAGVTQEAVAYHLGVSAKTPYNWEHMDPSSVKKYHRISYRAAIEAALKDALIAGYLVAA